MPQVEYLLNKGYRMLMYNGQRDGSACNHLGNLNAALNLKWNGSEKFKHTPQKQVKDENNKMLGFIRGDGIFKYMLIVNTGHLVPMFEPESCS